jgi:hypothetical protein
MKKLTVNELWQEISDKKYNNCWFIGQRKWSCALAREVLNRESAIRSGKSESADESIITGLVFVTDISKLDIETISDCDRLYVFDQDRQFAAIRLNQDIFHTAVLEKAEKEQEIKAIPIVVSTDHSAKNRYGFANMIGSLPDLTKHKIKIWENSQNQTWRFSHE